MTKPRDNRFSTPPAMEATDPKAYPKGLKPGDKGFLEALLKDGDIKFEDKTKR